MPEDFLILWYDVCQLQWCFHIDWQDIADFGDIYSDRDLFAMFLNMSV
jgi:hypothetical protein